MQPINYDADGRILTDSAGDIASWANGLPFTAEGALAISAGPVALMRGGVPMDATGKVAVGE